MDIIREYSFDERWVFSQGQAHNASIEQILLNEIPSAAKAFPAHADNDRQGTDWWVECRNGSFLSIDCKVREEDWSIKPEPHKADDLALETYSVIPHKAGWTRDTLKKSDYILWLWTDTGRWCLLPFPMLCRIFQQSWMQWRKQYKTAKQGSERNGVRWQSECVFVPRRVVWQELYKHFSGVPKS